MVRQHRAHQQHAGHFERRRRKQALQWMRELVSTGLEDLFRADTAVQARIPVLEQEVQAGNVSSFRAARELISIFRKGQ